MRLTVAAVLFALIATSASQAQEVTVPARAEENLDQLAWLVGSWHGVGLGGQMEENWTAAAAGTMLGTFRLVVEDKIRVIEYVLITQEEQRVVMRFKHFRDDYTTWEENSPLEFTLISISDRQAVFHSEVAEQNAPRRISYRLTDDDKLSAEVVGSDDEGRLTDRFEILLTRR
jgi:hypothetical protein